MNKPKLYIDFDNTLVNTTEAICKLYNEKYKHHKDFVPARWWEVKRYDFADECYLMPYSELLKIFESDEFFEIVEFMPYASSVTLELAEKYDIYIVTIGRINNLKLKEKWIKTHMGYVKKFIGINSIEFTDKSKIDMSDGIHIDDVSKMLHTSNAMRRICYGDIEPWNKDWTRERCFNWYEIYRELTDNLNKK